MKKAFYIKFTALLMALAVLVSVMTPAFSSVGATVGASPASRKANASGTLLSLGGDYELPFIPTETEHDWDNGTVTTPPTCTQPGVRTYTCKINAKHTYTEEIPATGHTPGEAVIENETAATCTGDGSCEEVVYCSVCHAEISREAQVIPALGHDWDDGVVTKEATCTETGIITYTCQSDPSHTYTEDIPADPHTPDAAVIENEVVSTCSAAGSYDEVVYCSVCGEEISRAHQTVPIDPDAHDFGEWVQTKAPTATQSGEETRICKNDPSHVEKREIAPLGSAEAELAFLNDEIIIIVPDGAIPAGSEFDVKKIVPPPTEFVDQVKGELGSASEVLAYYEIRLFDTNETQIIHLSGEITIKMQMAGQYVGSYAIRMILQDEAGRLIVIPSWWENEYLCYKTDWLETYN